MVPALGFPAIAIIPKCCLSILNPTHSFRAAAAANHGIFGMEYSERDSVNSGCVGHSDELGIRPLRKRPLVKTSGLLTDRRPVRRWIFGQ